METILKILMVEDLQADAELIKRELQKNNIGFIDQCVETEENYIKAIQDFKPDIILSDYSLPHFNGMQALIIRQKLAPCVPFILITGTINEETAVEIMKAGADDYIIKENLKRLGEAFKAAIKKQKNLISKKEAEIQLRVLSRSVEQNPASIVITNTKGDIEYVNPKFTLLSGYSLEDVLGKNPRILKTDTTTPEEYKNLWQTITSGNDWHGEFQNRKKNGDIYFESASISPIINEEGILTHFIAVKEDITEKRNMLHDLINAKDKAEESDRLKTAFLHNISHEIRTPMNAIVGFSGFLNNPDLLPEKRKEFTDIIIKSSDQLLAIITDIVSVATIESGQAKIFEKETNLNAICNLLNEQFKLKAEKQNISLCLKTALPDNEALVKTDETKLTEILSNLISNAIKFTKQGYVNFGYCIKGENIEFYVEDTGIGIPAEMHNEIFKRFSQIETETTRQYGGSGLGLSISKAYAELLGGKMWLTSKIEEGATFYVTIPYKKKQIR